jgi:hypothetical protein
MNYHIMNYRIYVLMCQVVIVRPTESALPYLHRLAKARPHPQQRGSYGSALLENVIWKIANSTQKAGGS